MYKKSSVFAMKVLSLFNLLLDAGFSIALADAIDAVLSWRNCGADLLVCGSILVVRTFSEELYNRFYVREIVRREKEILLDYFGTPVPRQDIARISQIFDRVLKLCLDFETRSYPAMAANIPLTLALFLFVLCNNAALAAIILLLAVLETSLPILFDKAFSKNYERTAQVEEGIGGFYFSVIANVKKCWFINSGYLSGRLKNWNKMYYEVGVKSEKTAALYNNLLQIVAIAAQFGLYFVGAFLINGSAYSVSETVSLIYLGTKIMSMISDEAGLLQTKSEYTAAKGRIDEIHLTAQRKFKAVQDFVRISYDKFQSPYLKRAVSFTICPGDVWVIKGKNGSGKSTLVRALMNTQKEYDGAVTLDGEEIRTLDMRDVIYYVPQDAVNLSLSPRQLFQSCSSDMNKSIWEAFAFDKTLMDRPIHALSGGEQKKVHILCAFMSTKPLLILDEPESSLDQENRKRLYDAVSRSEKTVLIITNGTFFDTLPHKEVHI